jgi:hypothetical protein
MASPEPEPPGVIEQAINLVNTALKLSDLDRRTLIEYLQFVGGLLRGRDKPHGIPDVFISDAQAFLFFTYEHWKVSERGDTAGARELDFTMGRDYANLATCRVNFSSGKYSKHAILRPRGMTTLKDDKGKECPNGTVLEMAAFLEWNGQYEALRSAGFPHL